MSMAKKLDAPKPKGLFDRLTAFALGPDHEEKARARSAQYEKAKRTALSSEEVAELKKKIDRNIFEAIRAGARLP